jgi:hypothetical protein
VYTKFSRQTEGGKLLERPMRRREKNIEMGLELSRG